jgi:hypothetical protein
MKIKLYNARVSHDGIVAKHIGGDQQSEYCTGVSSVYIIRVIYPLYTKEGM